MLLFIKISVSSDYLAVLFKTVRINKIRVTDDNLNDNSAKKDWLNLK